MDTEFVGMLFNFFVHGLTVGVIGGFMILALMSLCDIVDISSK